ncbi:MAG: hypothetical protein NC095_09525 [Muribaculum sp.]|nr:hypothetical protein [Muribaculum sp.]
MEKLYVYADFDWLDSPLIVGELSFDSVRGNSWSSLLKERITTNKYGIEIIRRKY